MQREGEDLGKVVGTGEAGGAAAPWGEREGQERIPEIPEWIGMEGTLEMIQLHLGSLPPQAVTLGSQSTSGLPAPIPQQLDPPEIPQTCFYSWSLLRYPKFILLLEPPDVPQTWFYSIFFPSLRAKLIWKWNCHFPSPTDRISTPKIHPELSCPPRWLRIKGVLCAQRFLISTWNVFLSQEVSTKSRFFMD